MRKIFCLNIKTLAVLLLLALTTDAEAQAVNQEVTTVADKGISGMFLAAYAPSSKVCIDKNDAEVFSFYVDRDNGKPYFAKLMPKGGKFCLAPGDFVVVKTTEAMSIVLEETTKSSSVFYNNIICLSEDMLTEDYLKSHPLEDGECIYLLTNMERNGGFGFTHFTGVTMRKGCFFIVSNVLPETIGTNGATRMNTRALKDIEDGDRVPLLPGEAGSNDGFVTKAKTSDMTVVSGDANGDGVVNDKDVEVIADYITEKPIETFVKEAADVNADGIINAADIVGTVKIVMAGTE